MRKILILAAFGVAGLVSANGKSERKPEIKHAKVVFQLCGVMVTYYNSAGRVTDQKWFTSDQPTLNSCMAYQAGVIANLRSQGYNVQQQQAQLSNSIN